MVTTQTRIFQTGFILTNDDLEITAESRFGILWGSDPYLMTDWTRRQRDVEIEGIGGLTLIQLMGSGPRQITYRIFFDTIADFQALDALVQETGTLRISMNSHTVPLASTDNHWIHTRMYSEISGVLLRSLVSQGVAPNGEVEAEATFVVAS
jgi:hypothetical protein